MANFNKVILIGNITRDPELRYTPNTNSAVCKLGIATNRKWRDKNNQMQEETTFVDCEAWGRTAEVMNQYLSKGSPVMIEGRLRLDQWQDQNGNNRSKLKVVIEQFEFLDSRSDRGGGGGGGNYQNQNQPAYAGAGAGSNGSGGGGGGGNAPTGGYDPGHQPIAEDDIPF